MFQVPTLIFAFFETHLQTCEFTTIILLLFFHVMGHKALLSLRGQRGQNYFNQKTNTLFFVHSRN